MALHMSKALVGFIFLLSASETFCTPFSRVRKDSFRDVGVAANTDKVIGHNYAPMYEKYLEPVRHSRLRLLEIGLGCKMAYGPGHSLQVSISPSFHEIIFLVWFPLEPAS